MARTEKGLCPVQNSPMRSGGNHGLRIYSRAKADRADAITQPPYVQLPPVAVVVGDDQAGDAHDCEPERCHAAAPNSLASFGQNETERETELRQNWLFTVLRIVSYPTCSFGSPIGPCQKSASYSTNVTPPSLHLRRTRNGFLSGCRFMPPCSACRPSPWRSRRSWRLPRATAPACYPC